MLRELMYKDVLNMLDWMQDKEITKNFKTKFNNFSEEDIKNFIKNSNTLEDKHYAIIDDNDEYMGTVSLKNINYNDKNAEYAIVLRNIARGKGYANIATEDILNIAFNELKLHKVYLNVLIDNTRAVTFYEKFGFTLEGESKDHFFINGCFKSIKWYSILN